MWRKTPGGACCGHLAIQTQFSPQQAACVASGCLRRLDTRTVLYVVVCPQAACRLCPRARVKLHSMMQHPQLRRSGEYCDTSLSCNCKQDLCLLSAPVHCCEHCAAATSHTSGLTGWSWCVLLPPCALLSYLHICTAALLSMRCYYACARPYGHTADLQRLPAGVHRAPVPHSLAQQQYYC